MLTTAPKVVTLPLVWHEPEPGTHVLHAGSIKVGVVFAAGSVWRCNRNGSILAVAHDWTRYQSREAAVAALESSVMELQNIVE